MYLTTLAAENFRNLETFRLDPDRRFNLIEGRNGQGKTNFLEAVYLLSAFKSARDAKNGELVRFGCERATIYGEIVRRDIARTIEIGLSASGKKVVLDGKPITALPSSGAHLNAVVFGPDDLELTKGGPAPRRRFLDRATYAIWPDYVADLKSYRLALESRNKLLRMAREGRGRDEAVFESYEATIAQHAVRLLERRKMFLEALRPIFQRMFAAITAGELTAAIDYVRAGERVSDGGVVPDLATFAERLARARVGDERMGYTRFGPHADDLVFHVGGGDGEHAARTFASQGQHRTLVLALKIAELESTKNAIGVYPVFLLDDVSSELDEARNRHLMSTLEAAGGQVFITTTDRRWLQLQDPGAIWRVESGRISRL